MPLLKLPEGEQIKGGLLDQFLIKHRSDSNIVIRGEGSGLTQVRIPVYIDGARPSLSGLSIHQQDDAECLRLDNPQEYQLNDIWVDGEEGQTCYTIAITDDGIETEPARWAARGEEIQCARACNADMYSCFAYAYPHRANVNGWRIVSELTGDVQVEGFITNIRWHGGHTSVGGQGFYFAGNKAARIWNLNFYGHYSDLLNGRHMHIAPKVYGVNMFGEYMESHPTTWPGEKGDANQITGSSWQFQYYGREHLNTI